MPVKSCTHLALVSKVKKCSRIEILYSRCAWGDTLLPNRVRARRKLTHW